MNSGLLALLGMTRHMLGDHPELGMEGRTLRAPLAGHPGDRAKREANRAERARKRQGRNQRRKAGR